MFDKNKKIEKDEKYIIESDNLAIPEIHTGKVKLEDTEKVTHKDTVNYESVAVPEVHIHTQDDSDK